MLTSSTGKDRHRLRVKEWKLIFPTNAARRQRGTVTLCRSGRAEIKPKPIRRDKKVTIH